MGHARNRWILVYEYGIGDSHEMTKIIEATWEDLLLELSTCDTHGLVAIVRSDRIKNDSVHH